MLIYLENWLKQQQAGVNVGPLDPPASENYDLHGLTLKEIVAAHVGWIEKLDTILRNKNSLEHDPDIVGADHLCELGGWIYGAGREFEGRPEYSKLLEKHAQFHKCAGQILREQSAGKFTNALNLLRNDLPEYSRQLQMCLVELIINLIRHP